MCLIVATISNGRFKAPAEMNHDRSAFKLHNGNNILDSRGLWQ